MSFAMTLTKRSLLATAAVGLLSSGMPAFADTENNIEVRGISGRSVAAGLLSFLVWPGIGQAVNRNEGKKVAVHAVAGLFPPFRFWSGYDGLVDRHGGYLNGTI